MAAKGGSYWLLGVILRSRCLLLAMPEPSERLYGLTGKLRRAEVSHGSSQRKHAKPEVLLVPTRGDGLASEIARVNQSCDQLIHDTLLHLHPVSDFHLDRLWFKRAHSGTYQSAALPARSRNQGKHVALD